MPCAKVTRAQLATDYSPSEARPQAGLPKYEFQARLGQQRHQWAPTPLEQLGKSTPAQPKQLWQTALAIPRPPAAFNLKRFEHALSVQASRGAAKGCLRAFGRRLFKTGLSPGGTWLWGLWRRNPKGEMRLEGREPRGVGPNRATRRCPTKLSRGPQA